MVRIKTSDYVKTLASLLDAPLAEQKIRFGNFLKLLYKNHDLPKWRAIVDQLALQYQRDQGELLATLTAHPQPNATELKRLQEFLSQRFAVKKVHFLFAPPPSTPGLIVEVPGSRFDFSFTKQLQNFKQTLLIT